MAEKADKEPAGEGKTAEELAKEATEKAAAEKAAAEKAEAEKKAAEAKRLKEEEEEDAADEKLKDAKTGKEVGEDQVYFQTTQDHIDSIVKGRLGKQRTKINEKHAKETEGIRLELAAANKELEGYRTAAAKAVETDFAALPDEVKAMAPGDPTKPADLAALTAWLPKAKELATKIKGGTFTKPDEKKTTPKGNAGDPPPSDKKQRTGGEGGGNAPLHNIYRGF